MTYLRAQDLDPPSVVCSGLRRDARQRDVVAHAVALAGDCGVMPALEYLKAHAVRPGVIERVLLDPEHRRAPARVAA